jgi:hypothetical protein
MTAPSLVIMMLKCMYDPEYEALYWQFEFAGEWYQAHYGIKHKEWFR